MSKKYALISGLLLVVFVLGCFFIPNSINKQDAIIINTENTVGTVVIEEREKSNASQLDVSNMVYTVFAESGTDNERTKANAAKAYAEIIQDRYTWAAPEFFEGMSDTMILAGFLQYEGGEDFEKLLVAEIVMDMLNSENCPHDTLAELLCDVRCFGIMEYHWNRICENISEDNIALAEYVFERMDDGKDLTEYTGYIWAHAGNQQYFSQMLDKTEFWFETEHYIFYIK